MTSAHSHLDQARAHMEHARHQASPFVEKFARFGYAAKGVVYCIVGGLAAAAAFTAGGQTTGSKGALQTLADQPFGQVLLGVVALGLAGYSMWQFIRAIEDPENEGSDGKAIGKRIGFFISGVIHFLLVMFALGIIFGSGAGGAGGAGGGDDQGAQTWSARIMSYPMGQWIVGLIGAGIVAYGVWQIVKAFKADLDDQLRLTGVSHNARRVLINISRFGLAARGVTFSVIGVFFAVAAYQQDPQEARGLEGALNTLQRQPYGPWLLGIVALGLIAYGIYEFVRARYRQINPT